MEVRNDLPDLVEIITAYEDSLNAVELNLIQIATEMNAYEDSLNAVRPSATEIQAITAPLYRGIERNEKQIDDAMVWVDGYLDGFNFSSIADEVTESFGAALDEEQRANIPRLFELTSSYKQACHLIWGVSGFFEKKSQQRRADNCIMDLQKVIVILLANNPLLVDELEEEELNKYIWLPDHLQ